MAACKFAEGRKVASTTIVNHQATTSVAEHLHTSVATHARYRR
jgi:hypothetical protein